MFLGLGIDTLEERLFIGGAKVLNVEDIAIGDPFDLSLEVRGIRVVAFCRRGQKVRDHTAVDGFRRERLWHAPAE